MYKRQPLYHATGGIVGVASTFFSGATLILRRKFSVEKFWEDCVKYKITTVTYIGEMLRYLATAKESPYEKQHQIRGIFGNGLRPDVWKVFEERFNISNIIEFYGSSEGNISTCNVDSKFGAIGRITSRKSSVMRPVVSSVRDPSKGPGFVINVVVFFSGSGWEKT